jgi:uncharacterized membrane protein HdeD (DUF308 family)
MKVLLYLIGIIAFILGIYELLAWAPRNSVAVVIAVLAVITGLNSFAIGYKIDKLK